jgi:hypothetical protein
MTGEATSSQAPKLCAPGQGCLVFPSCSEASFAIKNRQHCGSVTALDCDLPGPPVEQTRLCGLAIHAVRAIVYQKGIQYDLRYLFLLPCFFFQNPLADIRQHTERDELVGGLTAQRLVLKITPTPVSRVGLRARLDSWDRA